MTIAIGSQTLASATTLSAKSPAADTAAGTSHDEIKGVAKKFEAIFLRQMLSAARNTKFGDSMFSGSQGMDTFRQMQDERFADIASDTGAFGLGKMIEAHLARLVHSDSGTATGNAATAPVTGTATDTAAKEATGNGI